MKMAKKAETVTESQNIFLGSEVVKYGKRTYTFEFYADAERDPEKEAAFARCVH